MTGPARLPVRAGLLGLFGIAGVELVVVVATAPFVPTDRATPLPTAPTVTTPP